MGLTCMELLEYEITVRTGGGGGVSVKVQFSDI